MKILFSDLDGTLLNGNESICEENIQSLQSFKSAGYLIAICTGRTLFEVRPVIEWLPFDYLVLTNGGHILNNKLDTLYEAKISHDKGLEIIHKACLIDDVDLYYCDGKVHLGYVNNQLVDHQFVPDLPIDGDFLKYSQEASYFQIICCNKQDYSTDDLWEFVDYLKEYYSDDVTPHMNTCYLDIVPKNCSKGTGVKKLLEILNIDDIDVYGIGDGENDIPLFNACNVGATFTYASKDVQKEVNHVYDYAYQFINEILGDKI